MPTSPVSTFEPTVGNVVYPLYATDDTLVDHIGLVASTTYAAGTVLGEVTASPGTWGKYAHANSDGTQKPNRVLKYACSTDASGNITVPGEWGITKKSIEAYKAGEFRTQELTGLDANNLADWPGAHLTEGSTTQGQIRFP